MCPTGDVACGICHKSWAEDLPTEPSGYRMEDFPGPTPAALAGARVVTTARAEEL